eukprot:SAG22_NODE_1355_length_4633_cov_5.252978_1_plen_263_part_00
MCAETSHPRAAARPHRAQAEQAEAAAGQHGRQPEDPPRAGPEAPEEQAVARAPAADAGAGHDGQPYCPVKTGKSTSDSVMKLYRYVHRIRNTDTEYSCAAWMRVPHSKYDAGGEGALSSATRNNLAAAIMVVRRCRALRQQSQIHAQQIAQLQADRGVSSPQVTAQIAELQSEMGAENEAHYSRMARLARHVADNTDLLETEAAGFQSSLRSLGTGLTNEEQRTIDRQAASVRAQTQLHEQLASEMATSHQELVGELQGLRD